MSRKSILIVIIILFLMIRPIFALNYQKHNFVLQPNFSLDNFMPDDIFGISLHYEYIYSNQSAILFRALGFRNPFLSADFPNAKGLALSTEYRVYMQKHPAGFHIGPTVEWIRFTRENPGSTHRDVYDIGVVFGYKKDINRITTDVSLKMGWYSPTGYPKGGVFPKGNSSSFNTTMLVGIGFNFL